MSAYSAAARRAAGPARAVAERFLKPSGRALVVADDQPGRLLDLLAQPADNSEPKWIDRVEQT